MRLEKLELLIKRGMVEAKIRKKTFWTGKG